MSVFVINRYVFDLCSLDFFLIFGHLTGEISHFYFYVFLRFYRIWYTDLFWLRLDDMIIVFIIYLLQSFKVSQARFIRIITFLYIYAYYLTSTIPLFLTAYLIVFSLCSFSVNGHISYHFQWRSFLYVYSFILYVTYV